MRRAGIIIAYTARNTNTAIARLMTLYGMSAVAWRKHSRESGLHGPNAELHSGRPRSAVADKVVAVINRTQQARPLVTAPNGSYTRWQLLQALNRTLHHLPLTFSAQHHRERSFNSSEPFSWLRRSTTSSAVA